MSRRIRVVRLIPVLDFGGVESRFVLQAERMDRERFDLRVCTFWKAGAAAESIRELGIPVDVLGVDPSIRSPRATRALYRYLRETQPDVLHASIGEAMWHGALAGAAARVPLRIIEDVGVPARSRFGRVAFSAAARLSHVVIGVSRATCDYLIERERMPRSLVRLLYNCGKPAYFTDASRVPSSRPFRVLTAGRLVEVKNHAGLIDAFARLLRTHPDAELWIAGEGPLREALEARIARPDVAGRVQLLGFRRDVRALLDDSDVFVLPSFSEGCSVALVEAMATSIPVIGSTASGVVEVMGDLGGEWLADASDVEGWADALRRMADLGPERRAELGARAREIAYTRFSPDVYISSLESLYREGSIAASA